MERKTFDFSHLLKNHEQKHKKKPAQFTSLASGVQKRLGDNLNHRKSTRLTVFDRIRNLSRCESPQPIVDKKSKVEHRRQQLEKWKEEKEKRKKEAAALKKKPFVIGVPHAPLKFVPPPPPPKPTPSMSSGRVTRSQAAKQNAANLKVNSKQNHRPPSFAPANASFKPPKNLPKVLFPVNENKKDKINYTFNPVFPSKNAEKQTKATRPRTANTKQANVKSSVNNKKEKNLVTRSTRSNMIDTKITKATKEPSPRVRRISNNLQSSSSSEIDSASSEKSPVLKVRTPRRSMNELKQVTPKNREPKSESSSEEKLRSPKSQIEVVEVLMTPESSEKESKKISPCVTMSRGKDNARREMKKKMEEGLLDEDNSDMESINYKQQLQTNKKDQSNYTFNPVFPTNNAEKQTKTTRPRTANTKQANVISSEDTKREQNLVTRSTHSNIIDTKITKATLKPSPRVKRISNNLQSSSSSEVDTASSLEKLPVLKARTPRKSINNLKQVTPKNRVPKSESSSEEKLRSPKSQIEVVEVPMTPETSAEESEKISPYVTMSRGKDNARREMKKKIEEGLLDEYNSDMETINHFRQQLQSEIKRMTEMCDVWDKIQEQTPLSDSIQELVLGAVGQARLLMSQKLQQFASLVERCARPEPGHALVTPVDLQGFWDMVYMQVENIDMRFKKLDELRARGWVEDAPVTSVVTRKVVPKHNAKKAAKPSGGPSRLREMIAAARKAKKEQEDTTTTTVVAPTENSKTFEAGFFCVKSPVRSPAPATPNPKHNLLKAVLSSEAKKASASKNTASFAMLRASILSKDVEDGIAPLPPTPTPMTPINLHATPARSILKSANVASEKRVGKKSIKVVLFHEADTELDQSNTVNETDLPDISGTAELHTDSGLSSMDIEKEPKQSGNKENNRRRGRLTKQDATTEDTYLVMTRSRRKSLNLDVLNDQVEQKTPRRSSRKKKAFAETENIMDETATPKRSVRTRKSVMT